MSPLDTFLTIKPKDSILKKHISYYYFHQSTDLNFKKKFTFYPNFIHGLTAYKNSDLEFDGMTSLVKSNVNAKINILYTMNYSQNISVSLNGCFNKIGVAFQVAGINHFVSEELCKIYNNVTKEFNYFGKEFEEVLSNVFKTDNLDIKCNLLDNFFLSKLVNFKHSVLIDCLNMIIESNGTIKVETLVETTGINRKTLLRHFQKHFCCSIEEYKKMVKFRNTLNFTQSQLEFNSLTEISLYNHYYDQSDFNKQFKTITNYTPKELLSKIKKMGEEGTYWVFE